MADAPKEEKRSRRPSVLLILAFLAGFSLLMVAVGTPARRRAGSESLIIRDALRAAHTVVALPAWPLCFAPIPYPVILAFGAMIWLVPIVLIACSSNRTCRIWAWFALVGTGALSTLNLFLAYTVGFAGGGM